MEEIQIERFISSMLESKKLREELVHDPDRVITRENLSPTVARIVRLLVPQLATFQLAQFVSLNMQSSVEGFWS